MAATEYDVSLRAAVEADAEAVAQVHLRSRAAAPMPPGVHGAAPCDEVWVAEVDGAVVAYVRMTGAWVTDLYVDPSHAGQGIGGMLLDLVKSRCRDGFGLWVFESNTPARAFYARHGLVEVERTDGSDNDEREPDIRMVWRPGPGTIGA